MNTECWAETKRKHNRASHLGWVGKEKPCPLVFSVDSPLGRLSSGRVWGFCLVPAGEDGYMLGTPPCLAIICSHLSSCSSTAHSLASPQGWLSVSSWPDLRSGEVVAISHCCPHFTAEFLSSLSLSPRDPVPSWGTLTSTPFETFLFSISFSQIVLSSGELISGN